MDKGASVRAVHTSGGSKRRRVRLLLAEKAGKGSEGEEVDSVRVLNTEGVTVGGGQVRRGAAAWNKVEEAAVFWAVEKLVRWNVGWGLSDTHRRYRKRPITKEYRQPQ